MEQTGQKLCSTGQTAFAEKGTRRIRRTANFFRSCDVFFVWFQISLFEHSLIISSRVKQFFWNVYHTAMKLAYKNKISVTPVVAPGTRGSRGWWCKSMYHSIYFERKFAEKSVWKKTSFSIDLMFFMCFSHHPMANFCSTVQAISNHT